MISTHRSLALALALSTVACARPATSSSEPSESAEPASTPTPVRAAEARGPKVRPVASAKAPAAPGGSAQPFPGSTESYPIPTAAESQETPVGSFSPVVPNPTLASKLPCPAGAAPWTGTNVIECRTAGVVGKSLSKRQGPAVWFHPNGKIARAGSYDAHEWTGRWWELDEEGRLESTTEYKAGKEDGLRVTFHKNGKRASETPYKDGKQHGTSKLWNDLGELMMLTEYDAGKQTKRKVFRYTLHVATPDEVKAMNDELEGLLAKQKQLLDESKKAK